MSTRTKQMMKLFFTAFFIILQNTTEKDQRQLNYLTKHAHYAKISTGLKTKSIKTFLTPKNIATLKSPQILEIISTTILAQWNSYAASHEQSILTYLSPGAITHIQNNYPLYKKLREQEKTINEKNLKYDENIGSGSEYGAGIAGTTVFVAGPVSTALALISCCAAGVAGGLSGGFLAAWLCYPYDSEGKKQSEENRNAVQRAAGEINSTPVPADMEMEPLLNPGAGEASSTSLTGATEPQDPQELGGPHRFFQMLAVAGDPMVEEVKSKVCCR